MEEELQTLKRKFGVLREENQKKELEFQQIQMFHNDPNASTNSQMHEVSRQLDGKDKQIDDLRDIISRKDSRIKSISSTHANFKQQLDNMKEELMYNQSEKENLSKKLNSIEKGD